MSSSTSPKIKSAARIHLVCGGLGAGKSTHANRIAAAHHAVRFAVDDWMQELFGPDKPEMPTWPWVADRVQRCERRIVAVALQILSTGVDVVLELGLMRAADRARAIASLGNRGYPLTVYWVQASEPVRRARVAARNLQRGETHSFEVTPAMFDAIERMYDGPTEHELEKGTVVEGE